MDFSNLIQADKGTLLAVRLKYHPLKNSTEYIQALPEIVQARLYRAMYGRDFSTSIPPEFMATEIASVARGSLETKYYAALWNLLQEYEFKQSFKVAE